MAVIVERVNAVGLLYVDFIAAVVLALLLLRGEKDILIFLFRTKLVVPFLYEQHACFRTRMRFEGIAM